MGNVSKCLSPGITEKIRSRACVDVLFEVLVAIGLVFNSAMSLAAVDDRSVVGMNSLSHVVVEINREKRVISANDTLNVGWGDELKIEQAYLKNGNPAQVVNFVGFANPRNSKGEDRGAIIECGRTLREKWQVSPDTYAIEVTGRDQVIGKVFVKIIQPELQYAVVAINGDPVVVSDGQKVPIKPSDHIEVKSVKTNVMDSDSKVTYQVLERDRGYGLSHSYELKLFRSGKSFAMIELVVGKQ